MIYTQQRHHLFVALIALTLSIIAFIGITTVTQPSVASAHAFVIGSDPVDGSTISTVPRVVHIYFNAAISSVSNAHVYVVQNGDLVDITASHSTIPGDNPRQLDTLLKFPEQLPQGSYEVRWAAVALDDGHTTNGIIGFNVVVSSSGLSGTPTLGPSTSNNLNDAGGAHVLDFTGILSVAWDWLVLVGLLVWIGILVTEQIILASMNHTSTALDRARKRAMSLQWLCLTAILFGELVSLVLHTSRLTETLAIRFNLLTMLQLLVSTNYGILLLIRIALVLVAMGLLYRTQRSYTNRTDIVPSRPLQQVPNSGPLRRTISQELHTTGPLKSVTKERPEQSYVPTIQRPSWYYASGWLLIAGLILLTRVLSSDAAQTMQPHISAIMLDWLFMVALGTWLGGLAYLAYILLPLLLVIDRDRDAGLLVLLQRRFAPFHLAAMFVLLVCGLFLTEASINNAQLLLSDPYGRTLLVLVALVVLMLILGIYALFVIRPRLTHQALLLPVVDSELPARRARQSTLEQTGRTLKSVISIQTWLGAGVLLCLALMAYFAPPIVFPKVTYTNPPAQATATSNMQTQQVGDLSVTLQVIPAKVNAANTLILILTDNAGNAVKDARVQVNTNMQIMDMGTAHATINGGNPVYATTFDKNAAFSMAGAWNINVTIQRPNQPTLKTRFTVSPS
jgi:putative copper export protein/methionine-rich copper-binding protein CopC